MNAIIAQQAQIGGISVSASNTLSGNTQESYEATPVAGQDGTLTTRTDDDTGVVTCETGHGIETGDKVMIFWLDAGVRKSRTNMDASVATNAATVDGGDGDNLPTQDDDVVVAVQTDLGGAFDGDDLLAIVATSARDATLVFYDSGDVVLVKVEIYAGSAWIWQSSQGTTTPITGNAVSYISIGCRDVDGETAFKLGLLADV